MQHIERADSIDRSSPAVDMAAHTVDTAISESPITATNGKAPTVALDEQPHHGWTPQGPVVRAVGSAASAEHYDALYDPVVAAREQWRRALSQPADEPVARTAGMAATGGVLSAESEAESQETTADTQTEPEHADTELLVEELVKVGPSEDAEGPSPESGAPPAPPVDPPKKTGGGGSPENGGDGGDDSEPTPEPEPESNDHAHAADQFTVADQPEQAVDPAELQEVLDNGEQYAAVAEGVSGLIDQGVDPHAIAEQLGVEGLEYISKGGVSFVFKLPDGNVLKLPRVTADDPEVFRPSEGTDVFPPFTPEQMYQKVVEPLMLCKGEPGFEQIVAARLEDEGFVVCKMMDGMLVADMTQEQIDATPLEDAAALMERCKAAERLGVYIDIDASNMFQGGVHGVGIIDPRSAKDLRSMGMPVRNAAAVARVFGEAGVGFFHHTHHDSDLPAIGQTFYRAYRDAFGEIEAARLVRMWENYGFRFTLEQEP